MKPPTGGGSSSSSSNSNGGVNIQELLQLADTQGSDAAVQWIKSNMKQQKKNKGGQVSFTSPTQPASRVGFDTGMGVGVPMMMTSESMDNGGGGSGDMNNYYNILGSPIIRKRIAHRTVTPHPTKHNNRNRQSSQDNNNNMNDAGTPAGTPAAIENPEETEGRLIDQFREAAKYVPYEFSSEIATFTVRRPYGIDLQDPQQGLFEYVKLPEEPSDAYSRRAHVSLKSSIEVVAIINANNSPFVLFDTAGVRYKSNNEEWNHIPNVDDDHPLLGNITYVNEQTGMECQYSLDEILEEALLVREQYCGTLTSTALGLDGRSGDNDNVQEGEGVGRGQQVQQQQQPPPDLQKAPSKDVAVETDERGIGTDTSPPPQQQQQRQTIEIPIEKGEVTAPTGLIGMMGSFFLNLLYGIFIDIPYRVICTIFIFTISYIVFQILYMNFAHGYNEWILNLYNHPTNPMSSSALTMKDLVSYTNRQPGTV